MYGEWLPVANALGHLALDNVTELEGGLLALGLVLEVLLKVALALLANFASQINRCEIFWSERNLSLFTLLLTRYDTLSSNSHTRQANDQNQLVSKLVFPSSGKEWTYKSATFWPGGKTKPMRSK